MDQVAGVPIEAADAPARDRTDDAGPDLTQRQRQILGLLQEGKSNKEIAAELGIGLGTVKQHINVLFKKLDVSNRTMAVSRSHALAPQAAPASEAAPARVAGAMNPELRPATVLSFTLPEPALDILAAAGDDHDGPEEDAGHALHRVLAAVASDFGAIFVARANGGDLVFGVQRCREQDVLRALRAAFSVARHHRLQSVLEHLRGGLDAGPIAVGITQRGVWDGEMIAGALLARGRDLADEAVPRRLALGPEARHLMEVLCGAEGPSALDFAADVVLRYDVPPARHGLRGRVRELAVLEHHAQTAVDGLGQAILVEGEAGIGKSAMLAALPGLARRFGLSIEIWRCLPPDGQPLGAARGHLVEVTTGAVASADTLCERLAAAVGQGPRVIAVDDVHWLPFDAASRLFEAAATAANRGRLAVIAARPAVSAAIGPLRGGRQMRLGRLDRPTTEALVDAVGAGALRPEARAAVCDRAGGVPLFAVQLARSVEAAGIPALAPPLPLVSLLVSRMDGLHLDRRLLRLLAERSGPRALDGLRQGWSGTEAEFDAAVRSAVGAGLLRRIDGVETSVVVGHPMLQAVLNHVMTDWQSLGGRP